MTEFTLLVAEDNQRDREFLYGTLNHIPKNALNNSLHKNDVMPNISVRLAEDEREALALALEQEKPMLISDIQMQSMTGIELARQLWAQKPWSRIILWSHYSDEIYLRTLQKIIPPEAIYGYVLKNKTAELIRKAATSVFVEGQCWIDPDIREVHAKNKKARVNISDAEFDALIDIALGLTDNLIASRRSLTRRGVQNRLKSLYDKLGVDNLSLSDEQSMNSRSRAINIAFQRGLINKHELQKEEASLKSWMQQLK